MKKEMFELLQKKRVDYLEKENELTDVFRKVEMLFKSMVLPVAVDDTPLRLQCEIRTEMHGVENTLFDIMENIAEIHRVTSEENIIIPKVPFRERFKITHQGITSCEIAISGIKEMLHVLVLYEEQIDSMFGTLGVVGSLKERIQAFYRECYEMIGLLDKYEHYIKEIEKLNIGLEQEKNRFVTK